MSLAPLRQPNNPAPISTLLALRPGLPQVAEIVEPATRGDPTQLLLWTSRSLRNLVKDLAQKGHTVCPTVVGDLLRYGL